MPDLVRLLISFTRELLARPAATLTRLSDDADEVWEPFLLDGAREAHGVAF